MKRRIKSALRVMRGGSRFYDSSYVSVTAYRKADYPVDVYWDKGWDYGFRFVVRTRKP